VLARIAVDIGGTFTDLVAERGERQWTRKVLTTPSAPEQAVLEGLQGLLADAALRPEDIGLIVHGTTLATNALIERKGARTAFLTTEGFRDSLELGTESRFEQYDLDLEKPPPLVPRGLRLPVAERMAADGAVLRPLDERSVREAAEVLRQRKVESVAIGLLHSYANPVHERRARELVREALPGLPVSISSEVSPEMREYERFTTTCANAYVQPLIAGYLARLEAEVRRAGFGCPLYLMISSGGLTTLDTGRAFPIRLVESGPAGGAIFARHVAARHGAQRVLSFDMGGTTAKVCLLDDLRPQTARVFEVARSYRFRKGSGMPVRIPVIEMVEIGAGGGSIARVDRMQRIGVGPDSAGADPGPACYARGGSAATVTDADLALGRIDPEAFAGGKLRLQPERARGALERAAAEGRLPMGAEEFAFAVAELVDEAMANAAQVHAVESGKTLEERTLIAFGGAAPLHVARVAEKLGIARIIIPPAAGVGSAVGFLRAPVSYEVARSLYVRLGQFAAGPLNALLRAMAAEAREIAARGAPGVRLAERRTAFARYVGQGHEIGIEVPPADLGAGDAPQLRKAFEAAYRTQYGRLIEGVDIEILTWTVTVSTPEETPGRAPPPPPHAASALGNRQVFDVGEARRLDHALYRRAELAAGAKLSGPAIIVEDSTSTVVAARYDAAIAGDGSIVLTRRGS